MNIFEYEDIAAFASMNGMMDYNSTLELMTKNRFIPFYEASHREIYVGFGNDYGFDTELTFIFDSFVKDKDSKTVIITG